MRYLACVTAVSIIVGAAQPRVADAACNLIPIAQKRFASTLGGVASPITSPGKTVTLLVNSCDSSPGFEPVPSNNEVELRFEPPGVGADTVVVVDSSSVQVADCTMPGGRCSTLSFTTPDTTGLLPPYGLAGPGSVTVRDTLTDVIAEIGALSLPAYSCDREPEGFFEQFTVLPPANSFADAVSGSLTELRATVDGGGDLLVPFDYWGGGSNSVLAETPGAPVAIFLQGSASIPAMSVSDPNTIQQAIAAQASPSDFLRSFTLDGRPLPPLLRITATGELLGSADAVESVLRLARNDGKGGADLYDLSDRLFMGRGPVVITSFTTARNSPIPLKSLRSSARTVAFAREESREDLVLNGDGDKNDLVIEVIDAESGLATNTMLAVTQASTLLPNNYVYTPSFIGVPAVDVDGDFAAFLESEADQETDLNSDLDLNDSFLRVFRRNGTNLTTAINAEAAPVAVINGRQLAVTGSRVFFRGPNPFVETKSEGGASSSTLSPDGKHLYAASIVNATVTVFSRDQTSGRLTFVESESTPLGGATAVAVSADGKNVYATCVTPNSGIVVFSRDDVTGQLTFLEQHQDGMGGESGLLNARGVAVSGDGDNVYVAAQAGGGAGAVVTYARNSLTGALTFLEFHQNGLGGVLGIESASRVVVSPNGANVYVLGNANPYVQPVGTVASFTRSLVDGTLTFISYVTPQSFISGGSLAMSPDGAHAYVGMDNFPLIVSLTRDAMTGVLSNPQLVPALPGLGGNPYIDSENEGPEERGSGGIVVSADGSRVYCGGSDGSAALGSVSTLVRNQRTGALTYVSSYFEGLGGVPSNGGIGPVSLSPDGRFLYTTSAYLGAVLVFRTDLELRAFNTETQGLLASHPGATLARVAGERAVVLTNEALAGADLNGDGDQGDEVAQIFDASGAKDSVTSLGVAANRVVISDKIVAMTVPESGDADTDLNNDGDKDDDVIVVANVNAGQITDSHLAAERIAASGTTVVFSVKEGDGTSGSVNGDGDTDDRVLRIYDQATGQLTELGFAVSSFTVRGQVLAFLTSESDQGNTDLNGDLDTSDYEMFIYRLDTGALIDTGHVGAPCLLPATCERFRPYAIDLDRQTVSFLEREGAQGVDLNGDTDSNDTVLQVYSIRGRLPQTVATVLNDTDPDQLETLDQQIPPFPERLLNDDVSFQRVRESDIGVDVNDDGAIDDAIVSLVAGDSDGDGTFDDLDGCVNEPNPDGLDLDGDALGDSACDPHPAVCPPVPLIGCRQAAPGKSSVGIKDSSDDGKDTLSWKWNNGAATALDDIGDPVSGQAHYSLCVYDSSGNAQPRIAAAAAAQAACAKGACWKAMGTKGYGYKDKSGHTAGTTQLKLSAGAAGKAKAAYKGKGALLEIPTLPPPTPVTVQLVVNENGRQDCWEATYTTFTKSDFRQFKAKSD